MKPWFSRLALGLLCLFVTRTLTAQTEPPTRATEADRDRAIATLGAEAELYDRAMACRTLTIVGDDESIKALASQLDSAEIGAYARLGLESIPGPAATDALIESLESLSPTAKAAVIGSLGRRRDARAVEVLEPLAASIEPGIAKPSIAALGAIASDGALEVLVLIRHAPSPYVDDISAAILLACERRDVSADDRLAITALTSIVEQSPHIAESAVEHFIASPNYLDAANYQLVIRRAEGYQQRLAELLATERKDAFRLGIQAARALEADSVAALKQAYATSAADRRIPIIYALSDSRDPAALDLLLEASAENDLQLSIAATESLGDWPDPRSVERLLEWLAYDDLTMVAVASEALSRLDAGAVDTAILQRLDADNQNLVRVAVDLAGRRGIASAEGRLFELVGNSDDELSRAAVRSLGAIVSPERYRELVAVLGTTDETLREVTRESLVAAGSRLSRDHCVGRLKDGMRHLDRDGQLAALEVAGQLEGDIALELLDAAGHSGTDSLVDAATRLLGRWSSPDAADVLAGLARDLDEPKYQVRALRGLLRIVRQFDLPLERRIELTVAAARETSRAEELQLVLEVLQRYPSPQGLHTALDWAGKGVDEQVVPALLAIARSLAARGDEESIGALERMRIVFARTELEPQTVALIDEAKRQAKTLATESGFEPLFDGSTLRGWNGNRDIWRAEGGAIIGGSLTEVVGTGNDFLCTDRDFENFELRLQFRLEGDGVNGGVNVRSTRRDDGVAAGYQADLGQGYSGGLFDEARRNRFVAPARLGITLNRDWNDYWIRCEGDRIRVWLNGTLTADYVETEDMPRAGIIALQVQAGKQVQASYRNIRLRLIADDEIEPWVEETAPAEEEFTKLFNGSDFTGWHGNLDWFRIEDEVIVAGSLEEAIPRNEFLRTDRDYGDFELRLQFQLKGGDSANAGVQIRTAEIPDHHEVSGYQADMGNGWWGCLYDESRRNRVLAGPAAAERGKMLRADDWNDYRIRCEGDRVRLWINDVLTVDYTESDPEIARDGIIAVQVHSGPPTEAWYRRIRILELD